MCTVYRTTGYFSKTERRLQQNTSVWPSSTLKTVDLGYHSSLSVAWMVRFWFKSFQNSTVHKTSLVQGSLFLLAVYTHEVPLCAPSFVAVVRCDWALRDIARLERGPRPELYPVTLRMLVNVPKVGFVFCKACRWLVEVWRDRSYICKGCRRLVEDWELDLDFRKACRKLVEV